PPYIARRATVTHQNHDVMGPARSSFHFNIRKDVFFPMSTVPTRINERLKSGLKHFQEVVRSAQSRDVNESDTVIIVTDMLSDVFGYDKYSEVTSELSIRGTRCDLATKLDGKVQMLFECKAVGTELKEA